MRQHPIRLSQTAAGYAAMEVASILALGWLRWACPPRRPWQMERRTVLSIATSKVRSTGSGPKPPDGPQITKGNRGGESSCLRRFSKRGSRCECLFRLRPLNGSHAGRPGERLGHRGPIHQLPFPMCDFRRRNPSARFPMRPNTHLHLFFSGRTRPGRLIESILLDCCSRTRGVVLPRRN